MRAMTPLCTLCVCVCCCFAVFPESSLLYLLLSPSQLARHSGSGDGEGGVFLFSFIPPLLLCSGAHSPVLHVL